MTYSWASFDTFCSWFRDCCLYVKIFFTHIYIGRTIWWCHRHCGHVATTHLTGNVPFNTCAILPSALAMLSFSLWKLFPAVFLEFFRLKTLSCSFPWVFPVENSFLQFPSSCFPVENSSCKSRFHWEEYCRSEFSTAWAQENTLLPSKSGTVLSQQLTWFRSLYVAAVRGNLVNASPISFGVVDPRCEGEQITAVEFLKTSLCVRNYCDVECRMISQDVSSVSREFNLTTVVV